MDNAAVQTAAAPAHAVAAADDIRKAFAAAKEKLGIHTQAPAADLSPQLTKLLDTIEHPAPPPLPAASPELVMQAPDLTHSAITQVFEQAARHVEDVAEALMQQAIDAIAQAKETAAALRAKGAAEASKIEGVAKAARETVHLFRAQHAKVMGQADVAGQA